MKTRNFIDLEVWQKAMALAHQIYRMTEVFPKEELFGLTSQLRRAAVSIPSNIAEGRGRLSDKVFLTFVGHARGSLYEVQTQIELAHGLGYLSDHDAQAIRADCIELARKLNAFLNKLTEDEVECHPPFWPPGSEPTRSADCYPLFSKILDSL